jgi:hypothetical protein
MLFSFQGFPLVCSRAFSSHSRAGGNPGVYAYCWIPVFTGMTKKDGDAQKKDGGGTVCTSSEPIRQGYRRHIYPEPMVFQEKCTPAFYNRCFQQPSKSTPPILIKPLLNRRVCSKPQKGMESPIPWVLHRCF